MEKLNVKNTKIYFVAMGIYWLVFGLITIFYPKLMDLFQTETGVNAKTTFSDHVWLHDGFDIVSLSILLFALSREVLSRNVLPATSLAAFLTPIALFFSLRTSPYWTLLFTITGLCCSAF